MPVTKNILTRVEILDELLNDAHRRTIDDLLKAINKHLKNLDYEEISKKTLQNDLTYLQRRGAPVKRGSRKNPYIYYEEQFSIKNLPISEEDVSFLKRAIHILKKATDLNIISEVEEIISRLENKVHTAVPNTKTIIAFEQHTQALGKEHMDNLFTAIQSRCCLRIRYQPFNKEAHELIVHPYMLKEFRNRWFLMGRQEGSEEISVYPLDRIKKVSNCTNTYSDHKSFDPDLYFNNLVGVSMARDSKVEEIVIKATSSAVDYILSKPIHHSQEMVERKADGSATVKLALHINYELKSVLLGYGPEIEVMSPLALRAEMLQNYSKGAQLYSREPASITIQEELL